MEIKEEQNNKAEMSIIKNTKKLASCKIIYIIHDLILKMMMADQTSLRVHNEMISCVIATHNYSRVAKYALVPIYVSWNLKKILWLLLLQDGGVSKIKFLFVYYLLFQTEGPLAATHSDDF